MMRQSMFENRLSRFIEDVCVWFMPPSWMIPAAFIMLVMVFSGVGNKVFEYGAVGEQQRDGRGA